MLKIALVGVGGISGAHIPAWEAMEDAELGAICDIRPERMEPYADKRHYTDFDEMLDKENIDILDICLPTYLHADYAVKALERGIHVICEKPVSLKQEDAQRVYRTAREHHVKFMVAQVLRFWPDYIFLKDVVDSGKYGKLISGHMSRLGQIPHWSWDGWMLDGKRSGLVPYDLHIHDLDWLIYALGKPAKVITTRQKRTEQDVLHAVYEYEDAYVTADASWYAAPMPFKSYFRFQFERAVVTNEDGTLTVYVCDGDTYQPIAEPQTGDTGHINLPKSDGYANEIIYFKDCVKQDKEPDVVKLEELEEVIRILNTF